MNDKKTSDDDFFEDDFNEDIDFEEESFDIPAREKVQSTSGGPGVGATGGGSKTPFIAGVVVAILMVAGYFGYRFYAGEDKTKAAKSPLIAQVPVKPKPPAKPLKPAAPKPALPAKSIAKTEQPKPPPQVKPQIQPQTQPQAITTTTTTQTQKPPSFDEKDLEKFLSGGGATATTTTTTTASKPVELKPSPETKPQVTAAQQISGTQPPAATPTTAQAQPIAKVAEGTAAKITVVETKPVTVKPLEHPPSPPATVAAKSATTSATTEKSPTIQEMQRELFTDKPSVQEIKPSETPKAPLISQAKPPSIENQQIKDQTKEATDALSRLNQQMETNLNQMKELDTYTRDVSQTVAKLNSDISAMDNRLLALTNSANSLSKDLGSIRGEVGAVKRAAVKEEKADTLDVSTVGKCGSCRLDPPTILVEEPEYIVHAVIPGRAWLKSSKGQILTVSEGDSLGNYGKVIIIDAASAVVLTSSGVAIR